MSPALDSLYLRNASYWPMFYAILEQQLGATATLINFGDQQNAGKVNASTFVGMRFSATGLAPTWTPSDASGLIAFETPFDLTDPANWLGLAPILTLNGSDEEMDSPDDDYWSRDDSAGEAFSIWAWIRPTDVTSVAIIGKRQTSSEEWWMEIDASSKLALVLRDEPDVATASRPSTASIVAGVLTFVCATYDGGGGATAADGIKLYINGVDDSGTAANDVNYVAMSNLGSAVQIGSRSGAAFFSGGILGGPWGPGFVLAELTPAQVANLYARLRLGLGI